MRKVLVSIALASAALIAAAPASAQYGRDWRPHPGVEREIRQDINQLDRRITRAERRRTISRREAFGLRRDANDIRRAHARYARNGLDRQEVRDLQRRVNRVHMRLRHEQRDWDRGRR